MTEMFLAGTAFSFGIYAGIHHRVPLLFWPLLAVLLAAAAVILMVRKERVSRFPGILVLGCCFLLGGWAGAVRPRASDVMEPYFHTPVTCTGRMVPGSCRKRNGQASFLLEQDHRVRIRVLLRGDGALPSQGVFSVRGIPQPIEGFYNPGVPLEEERAAAQRIGAVMRILPGQLSCLDDRPDFYDRVCQFEQRLRRPLRDTVAAADGALLEGMLLGGSRGVEDATVRLFSACGISHLLSVSGSHVALLLGMFFFLSERCGFPRVLTAVLAAVFLLGYAILCGLRAPVCRAVILGCAAALGKVLRKRASGASFLGLSAAAMLAWHPYWILDIGFQLSFGAAAGLLLLRQPLAERIGRFLPEKLAAGLSVPLAAQALTLPLLVHHFHILSPLSILANLVLVPLLSLALAGTAAALCCSFFFPFLGQVLLAIVVHLTGTALWGAGLLAALPGRDWAAGQFPLAALVFYGSVLLLLFVPGKVLPFSPALRKRLLSITVFGLVASCLLPRFVPRPFTAYFLDVGQGDCALIVTPEGESILIDAGGLGGQFDTGERIVVPVLRYLGIQQLDYLIISHGHHDHAGGAAGVARWIPVRVVLLPREEPSDDVERLLSVMRRSRSGSILVMEKGAVYPLAKGGIRIVEAPEAALESDNANENSAIVQVCRENRRLLFTGDATSDIELAAAAGPIASDVLKVSHHGSDTSSEMTFLRRVSPALAVISAGRHNRFGHPRQEVLDRLSCLGIPWARTDRDGAVKVILDDNSSSWYINDYRYRESRF